MSALSIFRTSSATGTSKRDKEKREANMRSKRRSAKERRPSVDFKRGRDAKEHIAYFIAESIMIDPSVDTGKLLRSIEVSNSDLNISDASILTSAAILNSIGATDQGARMLSRSSTVARMYSKFQLDDPDILTDFATLIFTLSSGIRKMTEAAVISSLKIRAEDNSVGNEAKIVAKTFASLAREGAMSDEHAVASVVESVSIKPLMIANAPAPNSVVSRTTTVKPSESASQAAMSSSSESPPRAPITERDLREFVKRRRSGVEPRFNEVFKTAAVPVAESIPTQISKKGVGYSHANRTSTGLDNLISDFAQKLSVQVPNNVHSAASFIKSDSSPMVGMTPVSPEVFLEIPDDVSDITWTDEMRNPPKALPSIAPSTESSQGTEKPNDRPPTLEELLAAMQES